MSSTNPFPPNASYASNVNSVQVVEVVRIESLAGSGTQDDPAHCVVEYWTPDGQLLVRYRPDGGGLAEQDIEDFDKRFAEQQERIKHAGRQRRGPIV